MCPSNPIVLCVWCDMPCHWLELLHTNISVGGGAIFTTSWSISSSTFSLSPFPSSTSSSTCQQCAFPCFKKNLSRLVMQDIIPLDVNARYSKPCKKKKEPPYRTRKVGDPTTLHRLGSIRIAFQLQIVDICQQIIVGSRLQDRPEREIVFPWLSPTAPCILQSDHMVLIPFSVVWSIT